MNGQNTEWQEPWAYSLHGGPRNKIKVQRGPQILQKKHTKKLQNAIRWFSIVDVDELNIVATHAIARALHHLETGMRWLPHQRSRRQTLPFGMLAGAEILFYGWDGTNIGSTQ
jgi:hypothetical protein